MVQSYRDVSTSMLDLYVSTVKFRTQRVMKILTLVQCLFLPMTFFAGELCVCVVVCKIFLLLGGLRRKGGIGERVKRFGK